ncbi:MAG: YciI family protein [Burkholderiales bacterium]
MNDYMLLIAEPRGQRAERTLDEGKAAFARMERFAADLQGRGVLKSFGSLLTDDQGLRVQVRGGQPCLVDGPFSEAKEMIGGYFLVECETREQAAAIAAQCPAAEWATVEVRPAGPCYVR